MNIQNNQQYENEIPKYFKSKESNVSKANKKSKHKHQYKECLLRYKYDNTFNPKQADKVYTLLNSYCTICGKIGDRFKEDVSIVTDYRKIIDTPIGKCYQLISGDELYEKYHNRLPVFYVNNILKDKYVDLREK